MENSIDIGKLWQERGVRLAILVGLAAIICLPMVLFNENPGHDTSMYYSRMIREIAAGRFGAGYQPEIPPLFSTVGALFAALGFHPWTAAKITSALFFVLTIFPLYAVVRHQWGDNHAFFACLLYCFCSRLIRYAGAGLLDSGKVFFLMMTAYSVVGLTRTVRARYWLGLAVGGAGLALIRGEGLVFSGLAFAVGTVLTFRQASWKSAALHVCWGTLLFVLLLGPWLAYNVWATGYPVTDARQTQFVRPIADALRGGPPQPGLPPPPRIWPSLRDLHHPPATGGISMRILVTT